ncbi:hypothetical protein EV191_105106 [Tamaricihabitans halophyticus]|uniref:Uncharacterized protein n=1 Tax=Tamaricihabitans halophyticus TaxID=1262583 RepID=A0A4R2QUV6_9PSEU|nr:hypothetical protein EV191_105106 [Tamaricihabitans halophyticus]
MLVVDPELVLELLVPLLSPPELPFEEEPDSDFAELSALSELSVPLVFSELSDLAEVSPLFEERESFR